MTKHERPTAPFGGAESERRVSGGLATANEEVKRLEDDRGETPEALPTTTIAITSVYPARLIVTGPSGQRYEWPAAGAKVLVAIDDIEFVLAKNQVKDDPCCGNFAARTYFVIE